jgi:hypothetical protein
VIGGQADGLNLPSVARRRVSIQLTWAGTRSMSKGPCRMAPSLRGESASLRQQMLGSGFSVRKPKGSPPYQIDIRLLFDQPLHRLPLSCTQIFLFAVFDALFDATLIRREVTFHRSRVLSGLSKQRFCGGIIWVMWDLRWQLSVRMLVAPS